MSTKTSIKRVALVAAAALTLGGFSAVSANAAASASALFSATGVVSGGTGATAATAGAIGDGNHYVTVNLSSSLTDGAYTITSTGVGSLYGAASINTGGDTTHVSTIYANSSNVVGGFTFETGTATAFPGAGLFKAVDTVTFTAVSSAAGTQVITATPTNGTSAASTLTITWGAAPVLSVSNSSAVLTDSATITNDPSVAAYTAIGTTDATTAQLKTYTGSAVAVIDARLMDNEATAVAISGTTLSASVSGAGLVEGWGSSGTTLTGGFASVASSVTDSNGIAVFAIAGSGASGTGTITISTTNSTTGVVTVIATKTISFYGQTIASLTPTVNYGTVPAATVAGYVPSATEGFVGITGGTGSNTGSAAVSVVAKDANGNAIPGGVSGAPVIDVTSSNTLVATVATTASWDSNATLGLFFYPVITPVAEGTTTLTFKDDATGLVTATAVINVSKAVIASVAAGTDASSYDPATKVKWTLAAKDAAGNTVPDGTYVGFWGTAPTTTVGLQGWTGNGDTTSVTTKSGVQNISTYAPVTPGSTVAITGGVTSATAAFLATAQQGVTVADATFTVNGGSDASGATDAANAATDAANAAADAADNATQAASEALAAVNSLATTVASLIAGIKAQITSLTNLITKIKNKVGA